MTLAELISRVRTDANDKVQPYFWSDEEITAWLNDAVDEAAVRGRLIHESVLPEVCLIEVHAGVAVYPLNPALYELDHLGFKHEYGDRTESLKLRSVEALDAVTPHWRERSGRPLYAIQSDTTIRLVPTPDHDGELRLEGYRLPLAPILLVDKETATPEISAAHHVHLIQWVLHQGFSVPDAESFDQERAKLGEEAFTAYFGLRPDSDLRRTQRADVQHHVEAFWP